MRCPECNGRGVTFYYVETDRDEYSVTIKQIKDICRTCNGSGEKPVTHADRIRAMSDEELADMVVCPHVKTNWDNCKNDCFACRLEWLQQPCEEGE